MKVFIFHTTRYADNSVSAQRLNYWVQGLKDENIPTVLIRHNNEGASNLDKNFFLNKPKKERVIIKKFKDQMTILLPQENILPFKINLLANKFFPGVLSGFFGAIFRTQLYNNLLRSFNANFPKEYLPTENDIVITSGPPSSVNEIGLKLKQKNNCRWILDYRDPWTFQNLSAVNKTNIRQEIRDFWMRPLEKKFLACADAITTASAQIKEDLPTGCHSKTEVIPNGSDDLEIDCSKINEYPEKFSVVFSGHIYEAQLADESFFKAAQNFVASRDPKELERFEIHFLGDGNNPDLRRKIEEFNLLPYTRFSNWMPLKDALNEMYHASIFLQLHHKNFPLVTNTKQFNYVALQKPILLCNGNSIELKRFLKDYESARICNEQKEIETVLNQRFNDFLAGKSMKIEIPFEKLEKISRSYHAQKMVNLIKSVAQSG